MRWIARNVFTAALALASSAAGQPAAVDPGGASATDGLEWRCVGPTRGGRVTTVCGVEQVPGRFYLGATGGGVWRTDDWGHRWRNVSDGFLDSPSIGAIRVAPSDPDVVWVGTGSDGIRSNIIAGDGVYRSTDAGKTWTHCGLAATRHIGALEIDPTNPDVAYVAALGNVFGPNEERGVYRTRDGGQSWEKVFYLDERTGVVDLELNPANPAEIYACAWTCERKPWTIRSGGGKDGVFKSVDGGESWVQLTDGLPTDLVGKSDLAVCRAEPSRVWVLIEAPSDQGGLYRSDDRGATWTHVSDNSGIRKRPFYYTNIDCDPTDPDHLYAHATGQYESTNGGKRWRSMRTPHGDNHDMWIHPTKPKVLIQANDGGANVTLDGGRSWSSIYNQPTAEIYQVACDDRFPYWLYGGQQDNSTIRVPSVPPHSSPSGALGMWQSVGGCETGPAIPKPGDPDIVYANCKGRFGVYNFRTGQEQQYYVGARDMYGHNPRDLKYRFQRVSPIHVSPHDPNLVYHCSQYVHVTGDGGRSWRTISPDLTAFEADKQVVSGTPITRDITGEEFYSTIYAIRESALQKGVIWVGSNDGPVHVTRNGGMSWKDVTPKALPGGGRVDSVEPSPHASGKAFITAMRYMFDDWRPYVFKTTDFGHTWTAAVNGLPADEPVRVVREDPVVEGLLYAGTERSVYVSFDDGGFWRPLNNELPRVPVTDLKVHHGDLVISTMGRSFWILDDVTPLRQWGGADLTAVALAKPRVAYRTRLRSSSGVPSYPSAGAVIDYAIPEGIDGDIELSIQTPGGDVIRTYRNAGPGQREVTEQGMRAPRRRTVGTARLASEPGFHRMRWDLRRDGRGPLVTPGMYRLVLNAGTQTVEQTVEIAMDPRVAAEGVTIEDLRAQEQLALLVNAAIERARDLQKRIDEAMKGAEGSRATELERLRAMLVNQTGVEYPQRMIQSQLRYISGMINRADQHPGDQAPEHLAELNARLDAIEAALDGPRGGSGSSSRN